LKVLIIGSRIPWPLNDGGAIATYNLLKGLSKLGIEVHYMSLNTKKHFVDEATIAKEFSFLKAIKPFTIDTSISPIKALLNVFQTGSYNIDRFTSLEFRDSIQAYINENNFDLIHFEGLFVSQYIDLIKTKTPTLLRQHNIEFHIWKTLANTTQFIPKKIYLNFLANRLEKFEKRIIQKFDAVVSITEEDNHFISTQNFKGLQCAIPAGIEIKVNKDSKLDYHSIYHIGSMEWMPNQEAMAWFHNGIWPKVTSKNKFVKFYMAGKNMAESYNNWQTTSFKVIGEVEDQNEFIADKSILVVPLKSGSGIRIKTIEAMLANKAVVTTSQGALGLPIMDNEHCLIADDSEQFAQAIISLTEDLDLRNKIAENGYHLALQNFSNQAASRRWEEFYLALTKEKIN
jgi:glycosyltransferase involved in cell wall biosynthesis